MKHLIFAVILLPLAFSGSPAFARGSGMMDGGGMMDDSRCGMMGHGMQGCRQMIQGMR